MRGRSPGQVGRPGEIAAAREQIPAFGLSSQPPASKAFTLSHLAVIAPPFPSHVRALEALSLELAARGHAVGWVHMADVGAQLQRAPISFHAIGGATHPPGTLAGIVGRAARPGGPRGLARVIADMAGCTDLLCREAPGVLRARGVDAVLADGMEAAGGLVARALGLPFASVHCALPPLREPRVPLPVMPWGWAQDERGLQLNLHSARVYDWLMRPHGAVIGRHAKAFGLEPCSRLDECLSPRLQLSQGVAGFDFPREQAPASLHDVGPLRLPAADGERPWPAQWQPPAGVPLVFASLGTLQGGRFRLFLRIVRACRAAGAAVLVAHCGLLDDRQAAALSRAGATWVTDFAPQAQAVARADVVVTHGGLNTVMDALAAGKPMLVLPIAFDQPGVAARVVHAGAGLRLLPALASARAIARALRRLLQEPGFARQAQALGGQVRLAGGVSGAADLVETVLLRPAGGVSHAAAAAMARA